MAKKQSWGFDLGNLDTSVRPQDDFFHHVSGGWFKKNPIPQNESRWGTFMQLRLEVDTQLRSLLETLSEKKKLTPGSDEQMLRDFYLSGMDMETRTALGSEPIIPLLSRIKKISSKEELLSLVADFHIIDIDVLWNMYIDQDAKETTSYRLHFSQGGLGMPDRDYYLKKTPEEIRVRTAYVSHVTKLFTLIGYSKKDAAGAAQAVLAIENTLAKASMNKEDTRDIEKTYNKKTMSALQKLAPAIDWNTYLQVIGAKEVRSVIVEQPLFLAKVSEMLESVSLEDWKTYCTFHTVNTFAGGLSSPFVAQQFAFQQKTLYGLPSMKPLWRRVLGTLNNSIGELLGKEYVQQHFSEEAKKKALSLVRDLCEAYRERIQKLEWMSPATKKKALKKLANMNPKIGYPDKWRSYKGLSILPQEYVGNIIRTRRFEHRVEMKKLGKPIDRKEWFMLPQTVNAYFAPSLNDIVFPAAILQPPFFSVLNDDAVNYGSIGSVIGHELTHGFDDEGSKRDEHGNVKDWWTALDKKKFKAKATLLKKQFDAYSVADGVSVNGTLTLGENIADLGGVVIAFDAYQRHLQKTGRKDIDRYTPEQRFFIGFALFDSEQSRPEQEKTAALTDPHSPALFRINGPLENVDSFYEAYGVTSNDALFKPSAKRIRIW